MQKIGISVSGPGAYFCAPMYRFSSRDFQRWLLEIEKFIAGGRTNDYAEDAFNEIAGEIALYPLYFTEFCIEIDTLDDLKEAESWVKGP